MLLECSQGHPGFDGDGEVTTGMVNQAIEVLGADEEINVFGQTAPVEFAALATDEKPPLVRMGAGNHLSELVLGLREDAQGWGGVGNKGLVDLVLVESREVLKGADLFGANDGGEDGSNRIHWN